MKCYCTRTTGVRFVHEGYTYMLACAVELCVHTVGGAWARRVGRPAADPAGSSLHDFLLFPTGATTQAWLGLPD